MVTATAASGPSPFFKSNYSDVNFLNNYSHYGHSAVSATSKSVLTSFSHRSYSPSSTTHSMNSVATSLVNARPITGSNLALEPTSTGTACVTHVPYTSSRVKNPFLAAADSSELSSLQSHDNENIVELNADIFIPKRSRVSKPRYKSLLFPEGKVKRFLNRLDTDSFSIFSLRSSHSVVPLTINHVPLEVMRLIIDYVDDTRSSITCLYVNKAFNRAAKFTVYKNLSLRSTYRVAQLVSCLKENPENGILVKSLNLSSLEAGSIVLEEDQELKKMAEDEANANDTLSSIDSTNCCENLEYALASWRDWKYKDDPLYGSSILNSYTLSKSKSTASVNSSSTINSFRAKMLKQIKSNTDSINEELNSKLKRFTSKLSKISKRTKIQDTHQDNELKRKISNDGIPNDDKSKVVKFNSEHDPKNQPYKTPHPYTNKYLLKYSHSKDLPIGYVLYLLELCPNLKYLNLSNLSLSDDFRITNKQSETFIPKVESLVNNVLDFPNFEEEVEAEAQLPVCYLSDPNANYNIKTFQNNFVKLQDVDIIKATEGLENLESIEFCSIAWLNYKIVETFLKNSKSVKNGKLKFMNFEDSGMVRGLNWAKAYETGMFLKLIKGELSPPDPHELRLQLARNIGRNY